MKKIAIAALSKLFLRITLEVAFLLKFTRIILSSIVWANFKHYTKLVRTSLLRKTFPLKENSDIDTSLPVFHNFT
jgi:hypothetical protein